MVIISVTIKFIPFIIYPIVLINPFHPTTTPLSGKLSLCSPDLYIHNFLMSKKNLNLYMAKLNSWLYPPQTFASQNFLIPINANFILRLLKVKILESLMPLFYLHLLLLQILLPLSSKYIQNASISYHPYCYYLVQATIISCLNFCNSLLTCSIASFHPFLNTAAKITPKQIISCDSSAEKSPLRYLII